MTSHLLDLAAAIALLLWGLTVLRASAVSIAGSNLAAALLRVSGNRAAVLALGLGAGAGMPSGTLLTRLLGPPLGKGALAPPIALAALLGAEAGAGLAAVAFAVMPPGAFQLLMVFGVVLVLGRGTAGAGRIGRALLGAALVVMSLRLLATASSSLAHDDVLSALVAFMDEDILLAATLGAAMALLLRSSLSTILLLGILCSERVLPASTALAMMLGANLGGGVLTFTAAAKGPVEPRQVAAGLLLFKALAVACCVWALQGFMARPAFPDIDAALLLAGSHLLFNVAVALTCVGLAGPMAIAVRHWTSGAADPAAEGGLARLDARALPEPSVALTCAVREVARLADLVELMLRAMLRVFLRDDAELARSVRSMDDAVDDCYREVKHYLAAIRREALSQDEGRQWNELMTFAIALEQVADTVERVLHDLEDRAPVSRGKFPSPAVAEACGLHAMLMHNSRLAVRLLLERDARIARSLVTADGDFLELERRYEAAHLERLSAGEPGSIAVSAVYLDLLGDFERMNTLLCSLGSCFLRLREEGGNSAASLAAADRSWQGAGPLLSRR